MPDKDNDTGFKLKIDNYVLCMILIIFTFTTLYMFLKDIFPVLTDDINENALTVVVVGFNFTLFQILWFVLRLSEAKHTPSEDVKRLNNENVVRTNNADIETAKDADSNGKMEVHITVNQSKGGA